MKMFRDSNPGLFFSKKEKERIVAAIQEAEKQTSGEIRVHLERRFKGDVMAHAREIFERVGMTKTEQRNGVLIYIALKDNKFSIIGDEGIDQKVPDDFWEQTKDLMLVQFKKGDIPAGIIVGIKNAGAQLSAYFPANKNDVNELPDDISYGS